MTPAQWLLHYYEINKFRAKEFEIQKALNERLLDRLEVLILAVNPEIGHKIVELKKQKNTAKAAKAQGEEITPDNFQEKWKEILAVIPNEIVPPRDLLKKKPILPTFNRSSLRENVGIKVT